MHSEKYRLRYLPLFYKDLDEKITYIAEKLKNPKAICVLFVCHGRSKVKTA